MTLTALLNEQRQAMQQFLAALETEKVCLNAAQVDGKRLGEVAEQKQALLTRLDQLEAARREQQREQGFGEGTRGAERLAISHEAGECWQQIRQLAEKVRQHNTFNGYIISQRLEHNQHAIDFLNRAVGGSVYGPTGHSRHKGFGGISSKA
ncbi:flagella synthesis protein FlgN [Salinicola avicenniae]|uniref:flagella synthesis protein FlgN n=1 Tax=Salinicola avicenniae TaxID=2916836 RepID=UPI002072FCD8|nr:MULTISPECIES: flagellar protein FlgN [unclassified Salinicola]